MKNRNDTILGIFSELSIGRFFRKLNRTTEVFPDLPIEQFLRKLGRTGQDPITRNSYKLAVSIQDYFLGYPIGWGF